MRPPPAGAASVALDKVAGTQSGAATFRVGGDPAQSCVFTGAALTTYGQGDTVELVFPKAPGAANAYIGVTSREAGR